MKLRRIKPGGSRGPGVPRKRTETTDRGDDRDGETLRVGAGLGAGMR